MYEEDIGSVKGEIKELSIGYSRGRNRTEREGEEVKSRIRKRG